MSAALEDALLAALAELPVHHGAPSCHRRLLALRTGQPASATEVGPAAAGRSQALGSGGANRLPSASRRASIKAVGQVMPAPQA
jgi:hypothetical protein